MEITNNQFYAVKAIERKFSVSVPKFQRLVNSRDAIAIFKASCKAIEHFENIKKIISNTSNNSNSL